jgi:hypothetical protein
MKTEIVTLCEYASENNGRLTIVDTFDVLNVDRLPWRAYFYIAAKMNVEGEECNYNTITISIVKASDETQSLFQANSKFTKGEGNLKHINVVAGLKGLIFSEEGDYKLRICLDEAMIVDYKFKVAIHG